MSNIKYPDTLKLTEGSTSELRGRISPQLMTSFCTHLYLPNLSHILFAKSLYIPTMNLHQDVNMPSHSSVQFSSVAQSCPTLRPHEPQHARPPCPSSTPGLYSNWFPLSRWCHATILSSVVPFSSCLQFFPVSGSFQISQLFTSGGQNIGVSFNICPSNERPGLISFRMDWLDLLAVQGTLKSLLQHHSLKASIRWHSALFTIQLSHPYMTTGKTIALTRRTFVDKVTSLLFNMLSRLVITFLPRSKCLLILWLQKWKWSRSLMSDSSRPHGQQPTRLLHPWDFPGKRTGVGCHCLLSTV